jgi:zinc transporter ZupT
MDSLAVFLIYAGIMFVVCIIGSALPQVRKLNDSQKHMLVALSAGIFLALLFCLFIPESFELTVEAGDYDADQMAYMMLFGFLLLAFIDRLLRHKHTHMCACELHEDDHKHELVSLSAFIGLSIHAACDGLALAAATFGGDEIGLVALGGLCLHKFVETFSLSSSMLLSDDDMRKRWMYLVSFSLITPVLGTLFFLFFNGLEVDSIAGLPMCFATGTFIFVIFCNILPEAFHREKSDFKSYGMVVLGVLIAVLALMLINMVGAEF